METTSELNAQQISRINKLLARIARLEKLGDDKTAAQWQQLDDARVQLRVVRGY